MKTIWPKSTVQLHAIQSYLNKDKTFLFELFFKHQMIKHNERNTL